MFKKKKTKENENAIKELTSLVKLIHHPFITLESNQSMSFRDLNFYINEKRIGGISDYRDFDENIENCFLFDLYLSQEVKDELRPIILKWVNDSNEYYNKKREIESKEREIKIKQENDKLLEYIKSLK